MKRIGIIDFDTSHASAFVSRLNHVGVPEDQWVEGARVVVGCPGKSLLAPERIGPETAAIQKLGLPLVGTPEEMLSHRLDAVFVESNSGYQHLERVAFFLERRLPVFVDKPFACTRADAERMIELADRAKAPIFSSSSLRFAPEVVEFVRDKGTAKGLGVAVQGPGPTHPKNPGLFHYGIHAVEMLYTILGPGCEWLTCASSEGSDLVTGVWKDGRIGTVRAIRPGSDFGFTAYLGGQTTYHPVGAGVIYRELLKAIVGMLESGRPPIPPAQTLEIIRFIEEARSSAENHGAPRYL